MRRLFYNGKEFKNISSLLSHATEIRDVNLLRSSFPNSFNISECFQKAAETGDQKMVEFFIRETKFTQWELNSAAETAMTAGHKKVVLLLLDNGANLPDYGIEYAVLQSYNKYLF